MRFRNIYAEREAGRPRQHEVSVEAHRELVFQAGEHEGSPGVGVGDSSRTQPGGPVRGQGPWRGRVGDWSTLSGEAPREVVFQGGLTRRRRWCLQLSAIPGGPVARADAVVPRKRRLSQGRERADKYQWEATCESSVRVQSREVRTCEFTCRQEAASRTACGRQSGCAAKAIFYCPSMNSHRPRSQNISKKRTLRGVLGNKCAGQHNITWEPFILKRQLFKVIFGHDHQPYAVFFAALYLPQDGGGELSCSVSGGDPLFALLEGALGQQGACQLWFHFEGEIKGRWCEIWQ